MKDPAQTASAFTATGISKASLTADRMIILGLLAGAFIALAGAGSLVASSTIAVPSAAKIVSAAVFPAGLAMVVLAGSELFTGNCMMSISLLEKKIQASSMLRNWVIVYLANFAGSLLVALAFTYGHIPDLFDGSLAETVTSSAAAKCGLSFGDAFIRGILCNFLVCIAVWIASASGTAAGKLAGLYLPIFLFVLCGFEHCIANMFFIPAGIFTAAEYGIAAEGLDWMSFLAGNLLPVTLGNIVGGCIVGAAYRYAYLRK